MVKTKHENENISTEFGPISLSEFVVYIFCYW